MQMKVIKLYMQHQPQRHSSFSSKKKKRRGKNLKKIDKIIILNALISLMEQATPNLELMSLKCFHLPQLSVPWMTSMTPCFERQFEGMWQAVGP